MNPLDELFGQFGEQFLTNFLNWLETESIELAREGRRWDTQKWDLCSISNDEKEALIRRYIAQLHLTQGNDEE